MAFRPPNIKAVINLKVLAGVAKPNPKMGFLFKIIIEIRAVAWTFGY